MSGLFFGCKSLKTIELNKYKISITSLNDLFNGCTSLSTVTLNVTSVKSVDRVFKNCNNLKYMDLSGFNSNDIAFYVEEFFPTKTLNTIIIYNSTLFTKLERRIPSGWTKVDVEKKE